MDVPGETKKEIKELKKERGERGFTFYDVCDMDVWFLKIMPEMLDEFINKVDSYPGEFSDQYALKHGFDPYNLTIEQQKQVDKACFRRWINILKRMRDGFRNGNREDYMYKNEYSEEYNRLYNEYTEKYGSYGEKIKGNLGKKYLRDENGKIIMTHYYAKKPIHFEDVSEENKKISELYYAQEKKDLETIEKNKKKALRMFVKYFDHLWF